MKIVTWNCKEGLTPEKARKVADWAKADVYFIQEVEENNACKEVEEALGQMRHWYGDHKEYDAYGKGDLGIAIFSKEWTAKRINKGTERFRYVVPYAVTKKDGSEKFVAFHVWTKKDSFYAESRFHGYSDIFMDAMLSYSRFRPRLFSEPFIALGDFNFGGRTDFGGGKDRDAFDKEIADACHTIRLPKDKPPLATYQDETTVHPNDCFYISPQWNASDPVLGADCGSDHLPVMAELTLS